MAFELHPQLEKDLIFLSENSLFQIRLMPNSTNPWCVLIPKLNNIRELYEISESEQAQIMFSVNRIAKVMATEFEADKMNVGMLGNMVPQLHIHIICRYKNDSAWPGAIWGAKLECDENKFSEIKLKLEKIVD